MGRLDFAPSWPSLHHFMRQTVHGTVLGTAFGMTQTIGTSGFPTVSANSAGWPNEEELTARLSARFSTRYVATDQSCTVSTDFATSATMAYVDLSCNAVRRTDLLLALFYGVHFTDTSKERTKDSRRVCGWDQKVSAIQKQTD